MKKVVIIVALFMQYASLAFSQADTSFVVNGREQVLQFGSNYFPEPYIITDYDNPGNILIGVNNELNKKVYQLDNNLNIIDSNGPQEPVNFKMNGRYYRMATHYDTSYRIDSLTLSCFEENGATVFNTKIYDSNDDTMKTYFTDSWYHKLSITKERNLLIYQQMSLNRSNYPSSNRAIIVDTLGNTLLSKVFDYNPYSIAPGYSCFPTLTEGNDYFEYNLSFYRYSSGDSDADSMLVTYLFDKQTFDVVDTVYYNSFMRTRNYTEINDSIGVSVSMSTWTTRPDLSLDIHVFDYKNHNVLQTMKHLRAVSRNVHW